MPEKPSVFTAIRQGLRLGIIFGAVTGIVLGIGFLIYVVWLYQTNSEFQYQIDKDIVKLMLTVAAPFGFVGVWTIFCMILGMVTALTVRITAGWISSAKARIIVGLVLGAVLGILLGIAVLTMISPEHNDFTKPKVLYPWGLVAWTVLGALAGFAGAMKVRALGND